MSDTASKYLRMLDQNPKNDLARFSLGKVLYDAGDFDAAKKHFGIALQSKPDWMLAQILIGKCELSLGNRDAARRAFEEGRRLAEEQHHDGPREEMEHLLAELKEG